MKKPVLLLSLCIASFAARAQDAAIDWKKDIAFLKEELPHKHIDLFVQKRRDFFEKGLDRAAALQGKASDLDIALRLQQTIAAMGDSHTDVVYTKFITRDGLVPVFYYWFDDGLYILAGTDQHPEILGRKLVSVNGFPAQRIIDSFKTLITQDNDGINKARIPGMMVQRQLYDFFRFAEPGKDLVLETEDVKGERMKTTLVANAPAGRIKRLPMKAPGIGWRNERALFWDEYVAADSIYFVQYNQCWDRELEAAHGNAERAAQLPSFKEFEEKIFKTLAEQPVKKLVIDMRFNGGGSEEQGNELLKRLKDQPVNKKGKLFVIIGRKTFSSAVLIALSFKTGTNAILVGEATSGSPNHYGEVKTMQLPSSHMFVEYSTKHFVRSGNDKPTLIPDIPAHVTFRDFYSGRDPFYDAVKAYK